MTTTETAPIVSAALRSETEKRVIERAAQHEGQSVSAFIREAVLARAVEVANSLPKPEDEEDESRG